MFKAIGRYFRAFFYLITGRIEAARKTLSANPYVIAATYDQVIEDKKGRIQQYQKAIAGMMVQEEKKLNNSKKLRGEIDELQKKMAGAAAMAKRLVAKYGGDATKVQTDPDYARCQTAYKDFSSTLGEKTNRLEEIEDDLVVLQKNLNEHKNNIQSLLRDLDKIKEEKSDTIGEVISAKEEAEINNSLNGISEDRTNKELADMRQMKNEMKAQARISREMAGLDTARQEQEFLEYANQSEANDEFNALIGLAKPVQVEVVSVDGKEVEKSESQS